MLIVKDGWMDGEGMKLWLEKVWSKLPSGLLKKSSLLVCDQFKAHITESTKRLATKLKMHLAVIPGGLTSQLQPLNVSVNKPFKGFMQEEWAKWIEAPTHHITPAGRVKQPSISNVCEWVRNSWQRVESETIVKSLKKCGISNALDRVKMTFYMKKVTHRVKTTMKMILVAVTTIFLVSVMNKLYYGSSSLGPISLCPGCT